MASSDRSQMFSSNEGRHGLAQEIESSGSEFIVPEQQGNLQVCNRSGLAP